MLIAASDVDEVVVGDDFATLQEMLAFEPGPTVIAFLNAIDPAELDDAGQVALMQLWERQLAWMAERAVTATAVVCGPTPAVGVDDWNTDLVAAALGMTTGGARKRVAVTRAITEALPGCRAAMAAGDMSYYHTCVVVEAIDGLDAGAVAQVDTRVAAKVPGQPWVAFRRCLRAAVLRAAPDVAMAVHDQAARTREVIRDWLPDAMGSLYARLTAVQTDTVWQGLEVTASKLQAAAKTAGETDAGIDAYRADALVAWANTALGTGELPTLHGRRPQVQFIIDLPSLLGLADNPGELVGYGPIAASIIRRHAVDADWRRLVVDPVTGYLLDHGNVIYRPPQELTDFIVARDRRCRFPGCCRKATHCDIDHNIAAPAGSTSAKNCCCLCRRHHRLKTFGGWKVQLHDNGSCLWTAPNGRKFLVDPPPQLE
jgi:Domain of unknown function (DUF222)